MRTQSDIRSASRFLVLIFVVPFLLVACGEAPPPPPDTEDPPAEMEPEPADPMEDVVHATIPLAEVNGSGVTGEAMAMHSDDAVVMVIDVEGLPEEGEYAVHIHEGTCAEGGPVAEPLNPIMGLGDGTGTSTTTLEPDAIPEDEPHFIQVHGEGGTPIACGDIEGHGDYEMNG